MTNREFQTLLQEYPDDMPVRLFIDHDRKIVRDMDEENILKSSETAYVDKEAPEDQWDTEEGKIELGDGLQYILINPIIV